MNIRQIRYWDANRRAFRFDFRTLFCSSEMAERFWAREMERGVRLQFDPKRLPA